MMLDAADGSTSLRLSSVQHEVVALDCHQIRPTLADSIRLFCRCHGNGETNSLGYHDEVVGLQLAVGQTRAGS